MRSIEIGLYGHAQSVVVSCESLVVGSGVAGSVHMNRVAKALFRVPGSLFSPMLMVVVFTVPASQREGVHLHLVWRPVRTLSH